MVINFQTYDSLPCKAEIFIINDLEADINDFGYSCTQNNPDSDDDMDCWGCREREWIPNYRNEDRCRTKYGLSHKEFLKVCSILERELTIGDCGWCI